MAQEPTVTRKAVLTPREPAQIHINPDHLRASLDSALKETGERETILAEAERLVGGDRLKFYGPPKVNFKRIAQMWSAYLDVPVSELDVCCMMIALKVARIRTGGSYHRDSAVDAAGYARLLELLADE